MFLLSSRESSTRIKIFLSFFFFCLLALFFCFSSSYALCDISKSNTDEQWCYIQDGEIMHEEQDNFCDKKNYASHRSWNIDPTQDIISLSTTQLWGWWADIIIDDEALYVSYIWENMGREKPTYSKLVDFDKRHLTHIHPDLIMDNRYIISLYYQPGIMREWNTRNMRPVGCKRDLRIDTQEKTVWFRETGPRLQLLTWLNDEIKQKIWEEFSLHPQELYTEQEKKSSNKKPFLPKAFIPKQEHYTSHIQHMPLRQEGLTGDAYWELFDANMEAFRDVYHCTSNPHHVDYVSRVGTISETGDRKIITDNGESWLARKNNTLSVSDNQFFTLDRSTFVFLSPYIRWDKNWLYESLRQWDEYTKVYDTAIWIRPRWCSYTILRDTYKNTLLWRKPEKIAEYENKSYIPLTYLNAKKAFIVDPQFASEEQYPFVSDGQTLYRFDELLSWPSQKPLTLYSWAYENSDGFFLLDHDMYTNNPQKKIDNIDTITALLSQKLLTKNCLTHSESLRQQRGITPSCQDKIKHTIQNILQSERTTLWPRNPYERLEQKAFLQKMLSTR